MGNVPDPTGPFEWHRILTSWSGGIARENAEVRQLRPSAAIDTMWGMDLHDQSVLSWAMSTASQHVGADELVMCLPFGFGQSRMARPGAVALVRARAAELRHTPAQADPAADAWRQFQAQFAADYEQVGLPDLPSAVAASFIFAVNAGNLDEIWMPQHELFAAAAWLGILQRGRPALMTEMIAAAFVDYLREEPIDPFYSNVGWTAERVLSLLADTQGGNGRLLTIARQVLAEEVVRPVFPIDVIRLPERQLLANLLRYCRTSTSQVDTAFGCGGFVGQT